jgi:ribonucleoside-diphosphate reductase alpha chain
VDQCFAPETLVQTKNGFKPISEIQSGDEVLTSEGSYRNVLKNKRYAERNREMIELETDEGTIKVTSQHLVLTIKNGNNIQNVSEKLEKGIVHPEWVQVGSLKTDDLIVSI